LVGLAGVLHELMDEMLGRKTHWAASGLAAAAN
jgi:hypothetical protein